jgi:hypothetical protein
MKALVAESPDVNTKKREAAPLRATSSTQINYTLGHYSVFK